MGYIPPDERYRVFSQSKDGTDREKFEIMTKDEAETDAELWRAANPERVYWVDRADALGSKPPTGLETA